MNIPKSRLFLLLAIGAYIASFHWVYVTWLAPAFDYWGFRYEPPPLPSLLASWIFCILPGLWLPVNITRPSNLITWVLFITVFVPSMLVPLFVALRGYDSLFQLCLALFVGFAIVSGSGWIPLWKLRHFQTPRALYWSVFWGASLGLVVWVVIVYVGHFRLVTFGEIYQQLRFSGQDLAAGTGVNYAVMWLSGAFVPFMMSWALLRRQYLWLAVGAGVQVMLYSTAGLKSILLSVVMIPFIFFLVRGERVSFGLKISAITVVGFLLLNSSNLIVGDLSQAHLMLSALIFMRMFGISGLSTAQYHDFFNDHPWTHYSHVSGINMLVDYPYEKALGREVGYFYTGNLDLNSNAHLWCMDGLAGMGLAGVLLVSVLCAICFWLLDSCAEGHPITFSATTVSFAALNISNASLFTSLVSGGLLFSIVMLYLFPREIQTNSSLEEAVDDLDPPEAAIPGLAAPATAVLPDSVASRWIRPAHLHPRHRSI